MRATNPKDLGISKSDKGLEIAPWFNPFVPKSQGFNVQIADVFDRETLLERALKDPTIPPETYDRLEEVDYVGSATEIVGIVPEDQHGTFDYIYSSHNFEHLPNPIKFLQASETLLRPGGQLIMYVPDGRTCFDHFRPHTTTSEWLEAYKEDRRRPNARQVFSSHEAFSVWIDEDKKSLPYHRGVSPDKISLLCDIKDLWKDWIQEANKDAYVDSHCTVMTPSSIRLLVEDCAYLGLTGLVISEISETFGVEFLIRLERPVTDPEQSSSDAHMQRRIDLMHKIWAEHGLRNEPAPIHAEFDDRTLIGSVRRWNHQRRMRRKSAKTRAR